MEKEKIDFLPLGSLVIIKGAVRKVVIISRGLVTLVDNEPKFFDYGGCIYPEGVVGDQVLYFNHKDIVKVVHEGYKDEDDQMMVDNINEWFLKENVEKGDPYEINERNKKK